MEENEKEEEKRERHVQYTSVALYLELYGHDGVILLGGAR